jgi:hypothetical protein
MDAYDVSPVRIRVLVDESLAAIFPAGYAAAVHGLAEGGHVVKFIAVDAANNTQVKLKGIIRARVLDSQAI